MNKRYGTIGAIVLFGFLGSCDFNESKQFTITGEVLVCAYDIPEEAFYLVDSDMVEPTYSTLNDVHIPYQEESIDWSSATVVITHERTKNDGTSETIELGSESFVDGKVSVKGEVKGTMEVNISVHVDDNEELSITTMITPDREKLQFALVDYRTPDPWPPDELVLVGSSHKSKDSSKMFTVVGDLGDINEDLSWFKSFLTTKAKIWITDYVDGQPMTRVLGEVKLQNNSFLIQADIEEPRVATILVQGGDGISSLVEFIVEPNSHTKIFWRDSTDQLLATSNSERHTKLVSSWQQTNENLKTMDEYTKAFQAHMTEWKTLEAAARGGTDEDAVEKLQNFYKKETRNHEEIRQKLRVIRTSALQDIAKNSSNRMNVLLAMELGAFSPRDENRSEAFRIFDDLAGALDEDLVSRRVAPLRAELVWFIKSEESDRKLVAGQKVPEFTLPNLNGSDVELYDVLPYKELVLVEFWASWCGPCIAILPELKRLHANYSKHGFEIVSISIDDNIDDWKDSTLEHDLPWINLAELEGWDGEVATAYGVQYIPKSFLLDSKGNILQKDLRPHLLRKQLEARFDATLDVDEIDSKSNPKSENSDVKNSNE